MHVNVIPMHDEAHAPSGGGKNSDLGRFNGDLAMKNSLPIIR